jgi:hypothetical protein
MREISFDSVSVLSAFVAGHSLIDAMCVT